MTVQRLGTGEPYRCPAAGQRRAPKSESRSLAVEDLKSGRRKAQDAFHGWDSLSLL